MEPKRLAVKTSRETKVIWKQNQPRCQIISKRKPAATSKASQSGNLLRFQNALQWKVVARQTLCSETGHDAKTFYSENRLRGQSVMKQKPAAVLRLFWSENQYYGPVCGVGRLRNRNQPRSQNALKQEPVATPKCFVAKTSRWAKVSALNGNQPRR